MGKTISSALPTVAVNYDTTLILALETSNKSWVVAPYVPGIVHIKAKQTIDPAAEGIRPVAAALRISASDKIL